MVLSRAARSTICTRGGGSEDDIRIRSFAHNIKRGLTSCEQESDRGGEGCDRDEAANDRDAEGCDRHEPESDRREETARDEAESETDHDRREVETGHLDASQTTELAWPTAVNTIMKLRDQLTKKTPKGVQVRENKSHTCKEISRPSMRRPRMSS